MARKSTLPLRLQPMLATLTDAPFDDPDWVFEDKFDGFRMVAEIRRGRVALYSRNGKIISHSYVEVAKALEGVKADAVIDGELVAIGKDGASHFQLQRGFTDGWSSRTFGCCPNWASTASTRESW